MARYFVALFLLATVLLGSASTRAEPETQDPPPADKARNVEVDREAETSLVRSAARVALLPVRGALWLVFYPVREGLFLIDRYELIGRIGRLLSGDGPVTLYPSIKLEAGFGVTYGVGAGYRNYLRLQFLFGGEARQVYGAKLRTRDLFGKRLEIDAEVELQLLNNSRFTGIGNAELSEMSSETIDALADDTAVSSLFDQDIFRAEAGAWIRPVRDFQVRLSGALLSREFDRASDENDLDLADAYEPSSLVGYQNGLDKVYSEARFVFDTRAQPHRLRTSVLATTGWNAIAWLGLAVGLDDDPSRHLRYGFSAQRFIHLYGGDRVLIPRLRFEAISGSLDETNFVDLPALGGSRILRGYRRGRFRDRIASVGSLEYRFPLHRLLSGYLFAGTGRVFRDYSELTLQGLHFGGGGGVIVHSADRFLLRVQVGGGEDGIVFNASLSPSDRVKRATRSR